MAGRKHTTKPAVEGPVVHLDEPEIPGGSVKSKGPRLPAEREDPEDRKRRQEAFDSVFEWNEADLLPFSSSREGLFGQLRLSMGAPPLAQCFADADAFLADAIRILYLCSHGPEVWNRLRADPVRLQSAIDVWGEEAIPQTAYGQAVVIAMRIYVAAHENRHEPAPAPKKGGDDAGN